MHEKGNVPPVIHFGPFTLDGRSGELRNGPTRLKVPDQSIAILQALLERPGELVTRETLRDRLWGPDTFVDFEAGLNAAVRRLREALNDSADVPRYVETLPRRGYRFIAPVDGASTAARPAPADRSRRARARNALLAAVALAVVGAALWFGLRRNDTTPIPSGAARPVPFTSFPGSEVDPAFCPTGTMVAYAGDGQDGDNFDIYIRIARWLSVASDDGCGSRNFASVVAGLSTHRVRSHSEWKTFDCRGAGAAWRSRATVVSTPGRSVRSRAGSRGRQMASTSSSGSGLPPVRHPRSICHRSRMVRSSSSTHPPLGFADVQ